MEKNDKLIKDLLKEGFLSEAPAGFTDKVMNAVAETEKGKVRVPAFLSYFLLITGSVVVAIGSIYFTNKELLFQYYEGIRTFFNGVFVSSFHVVSNSFSFVNGAQATFFAGIILIIVLLLLLDKLAFKGRREMNLFI
ncbi:MAG: hypothetical protein GXO86_03330 [Chlorobi bacterium]|nr:hypothetical protein [Chlorobiota bacterium]